MDKSEQQIRELRDEKYKSFIRYKKHIIPLGLPLHEPCPVCGTIISEEKDLTGREKIRVRRDRGLTDDEMWTCSICVTRMTEPPANLVKQKKSEKPRGWAFMNVYVHKDGTVYHKGIEQSKLKGTLPITPIKETVKKKRITKKERGDAKNNALMELNALKKQLKKPKLTKSAKRKLESAIKKQTKVLNKYI